MNVKNILRNSLLHDLVELFDSQTSESSGTIMMVPLPMRVNNQRLFQEFALQTPKLNGFTVQPRTQGNIPLSLKQLRSF